MTSRVYLALCYDWMASDNTQRPPVCGGQVDDRYSVLKLEVDAMCHCGGPHNNRFMHV